MHTEGIVEKLRDQGIQTIRVQFADQFGVPRGKDVPIGFFEEALEEGVQFCVSIFSIDLSSSVAMGTGVGDEVAYADMRALPDISTLRPVPWLENTVMVQSDLYVKGKPLEISPRGILKKIVERYRERGWEPVIGTELEFYLLENRDGKMCTYVDRWGMCYTSGPLIDRRGVLFEIRKAMEQMGVTIPAYNHEFYASQYEINLLHQPALEAADTAFAFKQAVKEIALNHNLQATFMAKPRNDGGGSGLHVHLSLRDAGTGQNLFDDPAGSCGLSQLAHWFIGGQLDHARGMNAILGPTINSYKRHVLGSFAPVFLIWGLDNRTTYVRIPTERGKASRVENRAADGAANVYLAYAAILAAGLDGIDRKIDPGAPFDGDAYAKLSVDQDPVLPQSLGDAVRAFETDEDLVAALGKSFAQEYTAIKRLEVARFNQYVTDWEFNEYSFHL
ncbi:MAG: glutamine synthetase family protein [Chloroflexi bacterium]|nr:glutamine synthetase family protein [Chloroflexota bacterium]